MHLLLLLLLNLGAAAASKNTAATDCANQAWRVSWRTSGDRLHLHLVPPKLKPSAVGSWSPQRLLLRRESSALLTVANSGKVRTDRYKLPSKAEGGSLEASATVAHPTFGGPNLLAGLVRLRANGSHPSVLELAISGSSRHGVACQLNSNIIKDVEEVTLTSTEAKAAPGSGGNASVLELRLDLDPSVWRHFSLSSSSASPDGVHAAATNYFGAVFAVVNRALASVGVQVRWVLGQSRAYASLKAPGIAYLRQFGSQVPALQLLLNMEALADWRNDSNGGYDHHMLITRDRILLPPARLRLKPKGARLIGLSFVGSACKPNSRSVITDLYPAATARLIAHELGHVLGATDSSPNSSSEFNYLMDNNQSRQAYMSRMSRLFAYSAASQRQIRKFLSNASSSCLRRLSNSADQLWLPAGPASSAQDQCRHARHLSFAGSTASAKILSPPATTRYLCKPVLCSNGSQSVSLLLLPGTRCIRHNEKSRCLFNMICGRP